MSGPVLELFWDLSVVDKSQRITAAKTLVAKLQEQQNAFIEAGDSGMCRDLSYSIKRLTRGLCSSRLCSRQGFCLALAEVIAAFDVVDLSDVWANAKDTTAVTHGSRKDDRDVLFGRFFAAVALHKSGRLWSDPANETLAQDILTTCVELGKTRPYLCEVAFSVLSQIVKEAPEWAVPVLREAVLPVVTDTPLDKLTLELLMLAIAFETRFQTNLFNKPLLHQSQLNSLGPLFLNSVSAHPRVHSAWPIVLAHLAANPKLFDTFWERVVEQGLVTSTLERSYLAISLTATALPLVPHTEIATVLRPQVMNTITRCAVDKKQPLHAITIHSIASLATHFSSSPALCLSVLMHFAQNVHHSHFSALFKLNGLREVISGLDSDGLNSFVDFVVLKLHSPLDEKHKNTEKSWIEGRREWCVDQLCVIARNSVTPKSTTTEGTPDPVDPTLALKILKLLSGFALGVFEQNVKPELTEASSQLCATKFLAVLLEIDDADTTIPWMHDMWTHVQRLSKKHEIALPPSSLAVLKALQEQVSGKNANHRIRNNNTNNNNTQSSDSQEDSEQQVKTKKMMVCRTLLQYLLLYHTMFPEDVSQRGVLEDLTTVVEHVMSDTLNEDAREDVSAMDVLVEILLSLLLNSSAPLRKLVGTAFGAFSSDMTVSALSLVTDVLTRSPAEEAQVLGLNDEGGVDEDDSEDGSDDDDDDDGDDDDNDDKDNNNDNADGDHGDDGGDDDDGEHDHVHHDGCNHAHAHQNGTDEPSDDDDDNDNGNDNDNDNSNGNGDGDGDGDDDEDDDDDADDDDESMGEPKTQAEAMRYDRMLADAFKEIQERKKRQRQIKQSIAHFKLRVVSLLSQFVKSSPTSPLVLELVHALSEAVRMVQGVKDKRELCSQIVAVLSWTLKCKRFPKYVPEMKWRVSGLLSSFFASVRRRNEEVLGFDVTMSGVVYVMMMCTGVAELEAEFDKLVLNAAENFCSKKTSTVPRNLLTMLATRLGQHMSRLLPALTELFVSARSDFIRCEVGAEVLSRLLVHIDHWPTNGVESASTLIGRALCLLEMDGGKKQILRGKTMIRFAGALVRHLAKRGRENDISTVEKHIKEGLDRLEGDGVAVGLKNAARGLVVTLKQCKERSSTPKAAKKPKRSQSESSVTEPENHVPKASTQADQRRKKQKTA